MKRILFYAALVPMLFAGLPAGAAALTNVWSARYGDADAEVPNGVATDASGNVYLCGDFYSTIDFGGGTLTSAGGADIFLVKFNSSGTYLWGHSFGDAGLVQGAEALTVNPLGIVTIGGIFDGTVDFGGGPLTAATGNRDIFLARFDQSGNYQWSKHFGNSTDEVLRSLARDTLGNVYAAGYFQGSIDFGGGTFTSLGSYDGFLAKFDGSGSHVWSKQYGDVGDQLCTSVATDMSNNVYLVGGFGGSVNFGGGAIASNGGDAFLVKYDAAGTHQWSHAYGDGSSQAADFVATDATGNIYMTSTVSGTIDFGGGPLTSAGTTDGALAKFDATGAHQWSHIWGDATNQSGGYVAVGPTGTVYLGGTISGTVDFGGGPLVTQGVWDIFLAEFDGSSGVHQWSQRFGDASKYQIGTSVAVDPTDHVILTGFFQGTIDFGGGILTSAGSYDVGLAKFAKVPTGVHESPAVAGLAISAYPNPFNPETTIRYVTPSAGRVTVEIYDARGGRVATLVDAMVPAGDYTRSWNGTDGTGAPVSSGVYVARVTHPAGTKSYKLVLLK
jgi:FlgD Ig-like domain/Beta-propeller repeat